MLGVTLNNTKYFTAFRKGKNIRKAEQSKRMKIEYNANHDMCFDIFIYFYTEIEKRWFEKETEAKTKDENKKFDRKDKENKLY